MSRILAEYDCFRYKAAVFGSRIQSAACFARRLRAFFGWGVFSIAGLPLFAGSLLLLNSGQVSKVEKEFLMGQKSAWVQGDFDAAERSFETVLQESPGGPFAAEAYWALAQIKEIQGQQGLVVAELYESAARLSTDPSIASQALMRAAENWEQASFFGKAVRAYSKAQKHPSQEHSALHALANLSLSQGEVDVAMERFQLLAESSVEQWANIGQMGVSVSYARMGELDAALAEADEFSMRRDRLFERLSALRP